MAQKYSKIKLDDIARVLNVSKVTISKALRDHPDISPEMTLKVKKLAEDMGYMPNFLAKKLSSRKSNTIGLVVPKIAHVFFSSVIESIYDEAFKSSYEILLTVSQEQAERERKHILSLMAMRVDGIIISVTQETKDTSIFNTALDYGVPILFIDRIPDIPNISSVTCNDKKGAFTATEYAIKKGFKKIAYFGGYKYISIGKSRYQGFVDAMNKYSMKINEDWITEGGFGEQDGYDAFMKIYKKGKLPDYLLAVTYPVALGMYTAAVKLGIKIPNDIEVTCFGKNTYVRQIASVFNVVDQPTEQMGKEAFSLMLNQINNPDKFEVKHIELKTKLILHNSATMLK